MAADVLKLVESVLAEKTAAATKERELISNLNRVLPDIGYRVVPIAGQVQKNHRRPRRTRLMPPAGKPLSCPQCSRTFAHPLHLGRHMSATHGAGKGRAAKAKAAAKAKKKRS
jgi:uncharacterized C2H2 Zn-finger protein